MSTETRLDIMILYINSLALQIHLTPLLSSLYRLALVFRRLKASKTVLHSRFNGKAKNECNKV